MIFFKLEFYTNAATSRLKEQSPTWNCKKNENKANTHYETYCCKHQPFSVIFSTHLFFLKFYTLLRSNHHPEYEIEQNSEADTC